MHEQNGYLILAHLSDIELFYTLPEFVESEKITLQAEEFHHAVNVMRNSVGDLLHITDGLGRIYTAEIVDITKSILSAVVKDTIKYENHAENIWFCIPVLKNPDRLKFAFEKCVELGITNFVLFNSKYTLSKKINSEKFSKTTLAAMKQSLRAFLPRIVSASLGEILELSCKKLLFDQNAKVIFDGKIDLKEKTYFIFGPEGGLDASEIKTVNADWRFSLSPNRLRSETAVIKCASLLKL